MIEDDGCPCGVSRGLATAGGFPSSYRLERRQRYAFAVHTITASGGSFPQIRAHASGLPKETYARSPRIAGSLLSQADLPASIAASAVADYGHAAPYIAALF
jgi:hypothetical protein